jgi:hypothetical protein
MEIYLEHWQFCQTGISSPQLLDAALCRSLRAVVAGRDTRKTAVEEWRVGTRIHSPWATRYVRTLQEKSVQKQTVEDELECLVVLPGKRSEICNHWLTWGVRPSELTPQSASAFVSLLRRFSNLLWSSVRHSQAIRGLVKWCLLWRAQKLNKSVNSEVQDDIQSYCTC